MNLIKPSFEIIEQKPGIEGIYEMIETAGRTCYKSERKEGATAKDFTERMIRSGHGAMLEHGTVYLELPWGTNRHRKYTDNPYSAVSEVIKKNANFVTTNMRVLVENGWLDDLKFLCEPTEHHERRITVKFITSIGIGREFLRHRKGSFANESTRYCNYGKEKFGREITYILPHWFEPDNLHTEYLHFPNVIYKYMFPIGGLYEMKDVEPSKEDLFVWGLATDERLYLEMLQAGESPQDARDVLPLATKSELIMTEFVTDWDKFFDLRAREVTGKAHPDAKALAQPLMEEMITRGYIHKH